MKFTKDTIKKELEIDEEGFPVETLDIRFQVSLLPGARYEDVKAALLRRFDERFNELFAAELGIMPERLAEGEQWRQMGLFGYEPGDAVREAAESLHSMGAAIGVGRTD